MIECENCEAVSQHIFSFKGSNADKTKILFLIHDAHEEGQGISNILEHCRLTLEDILLINFIKCTLTEGDNGEKYQKCRKILEDQIKSFEPDRIIVLSKKTYNNLTKGNSDNYKIRYHNTPALIMRPPNDILKLEDEEKIKEEYEKIRRFLEE